MKAVYAVAVGGLAVLVAGPGRADDKKDDAKDYAKQILGKWEITKAGGGAQAGSTIDFGKDGKLKMVLKLEGADRDIPSDGTYKVEKDKVTSKFKVGDREFEETMTIKKLTADAMELEDEKGGVDVMKRVKEKGGKKEDKKD
ncbi:MAG: hypothetical protein K2X87_13315 [Gemmataceae bacterium]|nr:hypothetical protein [Gemmataceae bacterium]